MIDPSYIEDMYKIRMERSRAAVSVFNSLLSCVSVLFSVLIPQIRIFPAAYLIRDLVVIINLCLVKEFLITF